MIRGPPPFYSDIRWMFRGVVILEGLQTDISLSPALFNFKNKYKRKRRIFCAVTKFFFFLFVCLLMLLLTTKLIFCDYDPTYKNFLENDDDDDNTYIFTNCCTNSLKNRQCGLRELATFFYETFISVFFLTSSHETLWRFWFHYSLYGMRFKWVFIVPKISTTKSIFFSFKFK